MTKTPALDVRWTRTCFCGRSTATGPVASTGQEGLSFLTGSEEGRGPLFDITGLPFEGVTNPFSDPVQGDKIPVPVPGPPPAAPVSVTRIGSGVIAAIPAEPTKEVGSRVRDAVLAAIRSAGVDHVVIGGLANDYIQYITTPEEYQAQSYEAASTLYGRNEATFIQERLVELAKAMADGKPAPTAYPLDTSFGVTANGPAYPRGAASGAALTQPQPSYERLGHATFSWKGGGNGSDRPVDAAFVSVQRLVGKKWRRVDSDLGLDFLWRSNAQGRYDATWEIPLGEPTGVYRFRVTASRYTLESAQFGVTRLTHLGVTHPSANEIRLTYPAAVVDVDLTYRPAFVSGGQIRFDAGGKTVTVKRKSGTTFTVPAGASGDLPHGAAQDRYGNTN
jgi:neutral ceramidase